MQPSLTFFGVHYLEKDYSFVADLKERELFNEEALLSEVFLIEITINHIIKLMNKYLK
mgnify:FL=1|jgi:hypothetical protein|tara:strand:- start:1552 stop:1725 length:174 start_codon:yes stop_codon:yes gene_type:complete